MVAEAWLEDDGYRIGLNVSYELEAEDIEECFFNRHILLRTMIRTWLIQHAQEEKAA